MVLPTSITVSREGFNQAASRLLSPGGEIYYCSGGALTDLSNLAAVQAAEITVAGYVRPSFTLGTSVYDVTDVRWEASLILSPTDFLAGSSGSYDQVVVVLADNSVYLIANWSTAQPIVVGQQFDFFDLVKMTYGGQGAIVDINDT